MTKKGGLIRKFKNSFRNSSSSLPNSEQREDSEAGQEAHVPGSPAYSTDSLVSVEVS
jgi:hypothetical protein